MRKLIPIITIIMLIVCGCNNTQNSADTLTVNSNTYQSESATLELDSNLQLEQGSTSMSTTSAANSLTNKVETSKRKVIDITPLCQYPELPTGCEVTSLAMVLNYYNIDCDKCEISDDYLKKGDVGTVDFNEAFEGDPRDEYSFGCYANVIVETANKILSDKGTSLSVNNFTGTSLNKLYSIIDQDIPIIVWGTQDCREGHFSVTWNVDGKDITWFTPEHCMVLIGYEENSVVVADPIYGDIRSYDKSTFENSYNSLFKQAIVIKSSKDESKNN